MDEIDADAVDGLDTSEEDTDWEELDDSGDEEYLFPTPEEVRNSKAPEVGMLFASLNESVRFVNVYGKICGFSVVKGRNYKDRKITLQCNRSRKTIVKSSVGRKRKRNVIEKIGCQMQIIVKLEEGKWRIMSSYLVHNHDLSPSPSLTKFFLSHRNMTDEEV
jgi:hypothetical protein